MASSTPVGSLVDVRRDLAGGTKFLLRWLVNPVSADGAAAIGAARMAFGGPGIAREVEAMRVDDVGTRLLAERPSLAAALSDVESLRSMPEGSFAHAYLAFQDRPEVLPSNLLASALYRTGYLDRAGWPTEMTWLVERKTVTHDLLHVLSGYSTSLPAEAINIAFTMGAEPTNGGAAAARGWARISGLAMMPTVGLTEWNRLVMEGYRRGAAVAQRQPFSCIPIEELLPRALGEVRDTIGLPPTASPVDAPESWIRSPIGKKMAHGYGAMARAKSTPEMAALIDHARTGASPRELHDLAQRAAA